MRLLHKAIEDVGEKICAAIDTSRQDVELGQEGKGGPHCLPSELDIEMLCDGKDDPGPIPATEDQKLPC